VAKVDAAKLAGVLRRRAATSGLGGRRLLPSHQVGKKKGCPIFRVLCEKRWESDAACTLSFGKLRLERPLWGNVPSGRPDTRIKNSGRRPRRRGGLAPLKPSFSLEWGLFKKSVWAPKRLRSTARAKGKPPRRPQDDGHKCCDEANPAH